MVVVLRTYSEHSWSAEIFVHLRNRILLERRLSGVKSNSSANPVALQRRSNYNRPFRIQTFLAHRHSNSRDFTQVSFERFSNVNLTNFEYRLSLHQTLFKYLPAAQVVLSTPQRQGIKCQRLNVKVDPERRPKAYEKRIPGAEGY